VSLLLPAQQPVASGWQFSDFLRFALVTDPAPAGLFYGSVSVVSRPLDSDELWLIDHMVCSTTASAATTLRLYERAQEAPRYFLDGSDRGNFDVADYAAGLQVPPGGQLLAVWSGASAGAVGTLSVQGRRMVYGSG
jgi:hypothetical protein